MQTYLKRPNATRAAIKAGYSPRNAYRCPLFSKGRTSNLL
ncbi:terminase small subunit [Deinococcus hopiensis]